MTDFPHHPKHPATENSNARPSPGNWKSYLGRIRYRWAVPFFYIDWLAQWAAFFLSRWSILELLEYCGSFSILIAAIFYFVEAPERRKTKHYQAWQVINTAQGQGGSGGRIDALHELNEDGVPLIGVDVSDAFLQGVELENAKLNRSRFDSADLRDADLKQAHLANASMVSANLRQANLAGANMEDVDLSQGDLTDANLSGADLKNVNFEKADLRGVNFENAVNWKEIQNLKLANIHGIQNAPEGFAAWALGQGAVDLESDDEWDAVQKQAATQP
jgi:hypothetical protein